MSITIAGIRAAADLLADSSSAAERIEFVEQSRRAQANTPRGLAAELYAERRRRAAAADPGAALQLEEIIVEGTRLPKEYNRTGRIPWMRCAAHWNPRTAA
jgi:hypothetical protein